MRWLVLAALTAFLAACGTPDEVCKGQGYAAGTAGYSECLQRQKIPD